MFASKEKTCGDDCPSTRQGEAGQSFFEFILLLLIVIMISAIFMGGLRSGIKGYWRGAAFILCNHGKTTSFDCSPLQ